MGERDELTLSGGTPERRVARLRALGGLAPFAVYAAVFLGAPTVAVLIGAFQSPSGGYTLNNFKVATSGVYAHGFVVSLELAAITAVVPGILGVLVAYAVHTSRGTVLKRVVATASGVFANFGGVPLAFIFVASLGATGIVTGWLRDMGIDPYTHGLSLYTFSGVALVYIYFQLPLMVLVVTPALSGLKPAWREAAENLGARSWQFWRYVGGPVLMPTVLGCTLLLFGSGLSAYATAEALTDGTIPLTSIQIGTFLNGNVIPGEQNVGKALGFGLVVIICVVMVLYFFLQRRATRWLR